MNDYVKKQCGVDVNRNWIFESGDLVLVDSTDNIYQAIYNRLTCVLDDMAYFYSGYGSRIQDWLGLPTTPNNLDELEDEIVGRLLLEPRITRSVVNCVKINPTTVAIHIEAKIDDNDTFVGNFVFDSISREVYSVSNNRTGIFLHIGEFKCPYKTKSQRYVRRGEQFPIRCRVYDNKGNPVPIGSVSFGYGGVMMFDAPIEVEKGVADVVYTFPKYIAEGTYTIYAKYKGVGKYQDCTTSVEVEVVDKYPTTTTMKIKNPYLYVNQERVNFPTSIRDVLGGKVNEGIVTYSLQVKGNFYFSSKTTTQNIYTEGTPSSVFSYATVVDRNNNPITDGFVNFYIKNGKGLLEATKVTLDNAYGLQDLMDSQFYRARVEDTLGNEVTGGHVNFSYRLQDYLKTKTTLPDTTTAYHGINNLFESTVVDEDNINVVEGDVEYYVRSCGRCKPYISKIKAQNTYLKDSGVFLQSEVTDEDDIDIRKGDVTYNFNDVPIAFATNNDLKSTVNKVKGAVIMDEKGIIIDAGKIKTQKSKENIHVTNYVSSENVDIDSDNTIYFRLMKD